MDYSLQSDPEHRVVLVTLGTIVTEASALAAYTAVERFIATQGPHSGITDLSEVEKLRVSAEFVRHLAAKPPMIPAGMSRIAVALRLDIYGMSRMFQILREGRGAYLEVVHTLKEAFDLLGLPTSIPAHRSMTASIISFLLADEKPTKETKLFHGRKSSSQRCIDVGRIRLRIGVFATSTPATHSRPQTQFSSSEMAAGSAAMGN